MNPRIASTHARLVRAGIRSVAACILAAAAVHASAAATTVYKCFDGKLGIVYTDQPCRGEQLSIDGGTADPWPSPSSRASARRCPAAPRNGSPTSGARRSSATSPRNTRTPVRRAGYGSEIYYPAGLGYYPNVADGRPPRDHLRPDPRRGRVSAVPAPRGNLIRR